jgi:hypothetical protein
LAKYRSLIYEATTSEDFLAVWRKVVELAKAGDRWAVREFFDRLIGKAVAQVEVATVPPLFDSEEQQKLLMEIFGNETNLEPIGVGSKVREVHIPSANGHPENGQSPRLADLGLTEPPQV